MTKHSKSIAAATAAALALSANANAVEMFLQIDGITGESDAVKGAIDVLAWSWGMSQSGTVQTGAGKVNVQDLSFTHYVDSSSVQLHESTASGKQIPTATLFVRKEGIDPFVYLEIKLETVLVTSASTGGSGGDQKLTENVSLNFGKFTTKYTQVNGGPTQEFCWDIVQNIDCTP